MGDADGRLVLSARQQPSLDERVEDAVARLVEARARNAAPGGIALRIDVHELEERGYNGVADPFPAQLLEGPVGFGLHRTDDSAHGGRSRRSRCEVDPRVGLSYSCLSVKARSGSGSPVRRPARRVGNDATDQLGVDVDACSPRRLLDDLRHPIG